MSDLHARMLERAVEILGGPGEVAAYLDVSPARLRIWMRGLFPLPDHVFLRLVDLISEAPRPPAGDPRPGRAVS
jgi:hypothetical protein